MSGLVKIGYTNHRGETKDRIIQPSNLQWGASPWHGNEQQWLLEALDTEKNAWRSFAMDHIHSWQPIKD